MEGSQCSAYGHHVREYKARTHDVEPVYRLLQLDNVESLQIKERAGQGDGDAPRFPGCVEGIPQVLQHHREVLEIRRAAGSLWRNGIFPIKVEAVKTVEAHKGDERVE